MNDILQIRFEELKVENRDLLTNMSDKQRIDLIDSLLSIYRNISSDADYGITVKTDAHLQLSDRLLYTGQQFDSVIKGINEFNETIQNFTMTKSISSNKGRLAENMVATHISKYLPYAEIQCTSSVAQQSDLHVTLFPSRSFGNDNKPVKILVEVKNWKYPVNRTEINKFYRDMEATKQSGIDAALLVSLTSGIAGVTQLMKHDENPITGQPYILLPQVQTFSVISIIYGLLYLQETVVNNRRIYNKVNQNKHDQVIIQFEKFRNRLSILKNAQEHLSVTRKSINNALINQEKMLYNLQMDLESSCDTLLEIIYKS